MQQCFVYVVSTLYAEIEQFNTLLEGKLVKESIYAEEDFIH